jgi:hypothetical protein
MEELASAIRETRTGREVTLVLSPPRSKHDQCDSYQDAIDQVLQIDAKASDWEFTSRLLIELASYIVDVVEVSDERPGNPREIADAVERMLYAIGAYPDYSWFDEDEPWFMEV